ncbi:MAG: L-fuculokinase [Actinomycetota bacterium]
MSLLGIDIGSSAVKAAAYRDTGSALARAEEPVPSRYPAPGQWETDPDEVWRATVRAVRRITSSARVRKDPPAAVSVSASGRESFPARADGSALGPCLRTADGRRPSPDASELLGGDREEWVRACGHVPDHMDPTNRLLWWDQTAPRTLARARWFLGWHELVSLRMVGEPLIDPALASGFLAFDLASRDWAPDRVTTLGLDPRVLPRIVPWAAQVGRVRAPVARELGLPNGCRFVVGTFDGCCAAVGSAAVHEETAFLAVGSWESVVTPVARTRFRPAAKARLVVGPHPSVPGTGLWARSPNGSVAVAWARSLTGVSLRDLDDRLRAAGPDPSPVVVVPHLSGAVVPWPDALDSTGTIVGMSLATTGVDVVRGTLESIGMELALTLDALRRAGSRAEAWRVAGGGTRSPWWMQLKADLTGIPVEVAAEKEPGTMGAALLAGIGVGTYASLEEATGRVVVRTRFEPDAARRGRFAERMARYGNLVTGLLRLQRPRPPGEGVARAARG